MNNAANYESDIGFKKGDLLQIIDDREVDGWIVARSLRTDEQGHVPNDWITVMNNDDIESQKCFFKLVREEAEEKLLQSEIKPGTYLLRPSGDEPEIRHYKVRAINNVICYIEADSNSKPFSNIAQLIKFYTEQPGLQCTLKMPLPPDVAIDDLAIKFSDFTLGVKLGSGHFGTVYAGKLKDNTQVAVKTLKAGGSMTIKEFRQEAETMHKLRHPNLLPLLAISEDNGNIYVITDRMSKGALLDLLRNDTDNAITFKDLMDMAIQVAEGMRHLEQKGFVHRDLRAANVLVGDGNIVKIGSFGLARLLDSYDENEYFYQGKEGTPLPLKWTAPEVVKQQKFTVKSDVWSFGILLYEMVTYGGTPYAAMSSNEAIEWLVNENRLKRPTKYHCPLALYNVMKLCWLKNSNERPTFSYIKDNLTEIKTYG